MITLGYELSPSWNRRAGAVDLRAADEMTLRYDCFLGDVVFEVGGADLSARWGWVPVLDFALSLRAIAGGLVVDAHETFEFTESDATIEFERQDENVRLDASYAPAGAEVSHVELSLQAERFLARVVDELRRSYPELSENTFIAGVSRGLSLSA